MSISAILDAHYSIEVGYSRRDLSSARSQLLDHRRMATQRDNNVNLLKMSVLLKLTSRHTVYLARHTGDEVVIIFSARRGLLMQKYFTVPSWLAVVRCVSCLWLQLIP